MRFEMSRTLTLSNFDIFVSLCYVIIYWLGFVDLLLRWRRLNKPVWPGSQVEWPSSFFVSSDFSFNVDKTIFFSNCFLMELPVIVVEISFLFTLFIYTRVYSITFSHAGGLFNSLRTCKTMRTLYHFQVLKYFIGVW